MMSKKLKNALHINSYFLSNRIHYNFYKKITKIREDQFIIPVYKHFRNNDISDVDIDYVYDILDKKLFFTKAIKVLRLYYRKNISDFDYLHGHTLMSDGIPTFLLAWLQRKNYVVSVRNTDVNLFINRSWIFRLIGRKILSNAKQVFFISPSLKYKVSELYPQVDSTKYRLLPNGLDPYWSALERRSVHRVEPSKVKLLFVGQVIPRKNLQIIIEFLKQEKKRGYSVSVVGRNTMGIDFVDVNNSLAQGNEIVYLGEINVKEELREVYDRHDIFVLLSHSETFGVVYIEALSRSLPIIYSRGEGMDGYFCEGEVGFSNDKNCVGELEKNIENIISNYQTFSDNAYKRSKEFGWDLLIARYIQEIENTF